VNEQAQRTILFPLVGESHCTSGQCVSFSFIDAGIVLLPAFFFSFLFLTCSWA